MVKNKEGRLVAGRNRKNSAEYFSHDVDASSDEKIIYLESLFGHTGYAVYFKFLERMARSDNFEIDWNCIKKAIYAAEFHISVTEIEQIVSECCRPEIKAFEIEDGKLFSVGLKKRMQPLIDKREYNRKKYEEKKAKENRRLNNSVTEIGISADELTQRKGKESKGKEEPSSKKDFEEEESSEVYKTRKGRTLSGNRLSSFYKFWDAFDYKAGKAEAADAWFDIPSLTNTLVDQICAAAKIESSGRENLRASGKTPKMAQGWISGKRWEDEIYQTEINRKNRTPEQIRADNGV